MQKKQSFQFIIAILMEASRSSHVLGGRILPPSIRTISPSVNVLSRPEHVLDKPIQRIFEVANGLLGLAMLNRLLDTMLDVIFQDDFPDLVERGANSRNLRQHIIALTAFCPQPLQAVGMTGDARKPFSYVLA
jgi:hypothetical protein